MAFLLVPSFQYFDYVAWYDFKFILLGIICLEFVNLEGFLSNLEKFCQLIFLNIFVSQSSSVSAFDHTQLHIHMPLLIFLQIREDLIWVCILWCKQYSLLFTSSLTCSSIVSNLLLIPSSDFFNSYPEILNSTPSIWLFGHLLFHIQV